ncbi:Mannose-6-phosphate isomerase, class I [Sphingomonas gellani]|uniref:Mannose-6-phosphate isomerase, class I n=1 Tax=Sphingomonas gellani TaxID=1166340 RepID=A0A1H8DYF9_9SPHN|nr:class I mannose-6-phosphate isomerase [Sphingomonas gellani]SEN11577.1 Mannose-6-phosphate isomerase, class I [Sphingomonas gellani]
MTRYDKRPVVRVDERSDLCIGGWDAILPRLAGAGDLCVECYPGAPVAAIVDAMRGAWPEAEIVDTMSLFREPEQLDADLRTLLGDDPVFARFPSIDIHAFLDTAAVAAWRASRVPGRRTVVVGPGAAVVMPVRDMLVHVSMARWELQQRQRGGAIANLGSLDYSVRPAEKYRRAFFIDWRIGDEIKYALLPDAHFVIEMNGPEPRMIAGETYVHALDIAASCPFRTVPFFDAGPWGGQWMRERFDLPDGPPNYAWCFDCVPEENSLLLGFGDRQFEIPALDLVRLRPMPLLGRDIVDRFGAEFPIRFDMLDTMGGGNLSLQVHPRADYARNAFGLTYTQDESYYLLDAGDDASVYLGLTDTADPDMVSQALTTAQAGGPPPDVDAFVNRLPARRHDHFLIPAGTVHCSGRNAMVLEISATPYIFTFKLWDWGRLGLDGRPRPIHLEHGLANIDWTRREDFTRGELVNQVRTIDAGSDWRRERTGLHPLEFIETERSWFATTIELDTHGTLNVLNLVAGNAAIVESPSGAFPDYEVHYAETFVIPAVVGRYRLRSLGPPGEQCAVMRAWVRPLQN